ncbi:polysaccharide deacetylase family protein [Plastoroseomonas arctica]|nr:polysaccharide deacetylase family protein [Plastoroseomonas arctica]
MAAPARAETLVEPRMRLRAVPADRLTVAITLDACGGAFDSRIAQALVEAGIPATLFVTGTWLAQNPAAFAMLLARPDLFGFENHGARHIPAVLGAGRVFNLAVAGRVEAVEREVMEGAAAVVAVGGAAPRWYRGATGRYSPGALAEIARLGFVVAGYSLNGDDGAGLAPERVARRIAAAPTGSVLLAHINHPERPCGAGVAAGILALRARGATFVRLDQLGPEAVEAA